MKKIAIELNRVVKSLVDDNNDATADGCDAKKNYHIEPPSEW